MGEGNNKIKSKVKKRALISILIPILIIMFVAGAFYAIVNGIVEIIESVIRALKSILTKVSHPWESSLELLGKISNFLDEKLKIGDHEFDENALALVGLDKPRIIIDNEDFIKITEGTDTDPGIDKAQINRDSAGLEDYMLKIMLLSYYRSAYLSDYNIYIQITDEEKKAIEDMETDEAEGKYGCPFEMTKRHEYRWY